MAYRIILLGSLLLWLPFAQSSASEPVRFNAGFLNKSQGEIDLERFIMGIPTAAGRYPSDIYINRQWVAQEEVQLKELGAAREVQLCLSEALLKEARLKPELLTSDLEKRLLDPADCVTPAEIDAGIDWHYQMGSLSLELTIPQSLQSLARRGATDPEHADTGIAVATLNYNLNSYHTDYQGQVQNNHYLGLNGGANLGSWRLRHQSTLHQQNGEASRWDNIATYAERSLVAWRSHLRLGQGWTSGEFFDAMGYQGLSLTTDSRMLPSSQRGFAPTVRGNARSNARVTVEQNGTLLYETTVPPGNFVIDDLYPTGYGGDLLVTIHEADGQSRQFRVPYASVPGLVRDGATFYSATAGQVHESGLSKPAPAFGEATLQHGFNNLLSGYGGLHAMEGYQALLLGGALNTSWGALSLDLTHSRLESDDQHASGRQWRTTYNKSLMPSGTQISLSARKADSDRYFSPHDALWQLDGSANNANREKQRLDLSINQPLGQGSLYLVGSKSWYWQQQQSQNGLQLGYSNSLGQVSYQLAVQRTQDSSGNEDQIYSLALSMPLGSRNSLSLQLNHDQQNGDQLQGSVTGSAGAENQFTYGVTATRYTSDQQQAIASLGGNGSYRTRAAYLNGSVSRDNQQQQQYSLGARGALVAHAGGVQATPELGDTFAIVEAREAEGAEVANREGNRVNRSGYAIVPHLTPFEENRIVLDPQGMAETVELTSTSRAVVPDAGAAIKVSFPTKVGYSLLLETRQADGKPAPFGAEVFNEEQQSVGNVGQGGQLYARVTRKQGTLTLRWGAQSAEQCQIRYRLPEHPEGMTLISGSQLCQSLP